MLIVLAQKLRSCGVVPSPCATKAPLAMTVTTPSNAPSNEFSTNNLLGSYAEVVNRSKQTVSDVVCLHFQDDNCFNKKHILSRCLVGRWGDYEAPSFAPLKPWIFTQWRLKGNLRLSMLGGFLILLQFELKEDVDKALREGLDFYRGKRTLLKVVLRKVCKRTKLGLGFWGYPCFFGIGVFSNRWGMLEVVF